MLALTDIHDAFGSDNGGGGVGGGKLGAGAGSGSGSGGGDHGPSTIFTELPDHGKKADYVTPRSEVDRYVADEERARSRREARRERERARARRRDRADRFEADAAADARAGSERVMRKAVNASFTIATGLAIHFAVSELLKSYLDATFATQSSRSLSIASYPVAMVLVLWFLRSHADDSRR